MQIQTNYNVQNHKAVAFQSNFVNTKALKMALEDTQYFIFNKSSSQEKRQFLNAMKSILKDGKSDVIEITEKDGRSQLTVNNEAFNIVQYYNVTGSGIRKLIIKFAEIRNGVKPVQKYDSLSKEEATVVREYLNSFNKNTKPEDEKFLEKFSNLYNQAISRVDLYVQDELKKIHALIFKSK